MIIWIVLIALVAPSWIAHRHVPHLLVAGLAIHLYGILTICPAVVQLLVMMRTWHTAPVVTFQKKIAELSQLRIICNLALMLPWWVLWVAVLMVVAESRGRHRSLRAPAGVDPGQHRVRSRGADRLSVGRATRGQPPECVASEVGAGDHRRPGGREPAPRRARPGRD